MNIKEVLIATGLSDEIIEHLIETENCHYAIESIIVGAPISLSHKLELLKELQNTVNEPSTKFSKHVIDAIARAISELTLRNGELFLLKSCWYDYDIMNEKTSKYVIPCSSFESALNQIKLDEEFEFEGLDEESVGKALSWYKLEKWVSKEADNGIRSILTYSYILVNGEAVYVELPKKEKQNKPFLRELEGANHINLSLPFSVGDIIEIDCTPFAPVMHAMVLQASERLDPTVILYADNIGLLNCGSLNHSRVFPYSYIPRLSAIFRAKKYDGELFGDEERIFDILTKSLKNLDDNECKVAGKVIMDTIRYGAF